MPLWSSLTPLGRQLVLGVLAIFLLPTLLITKPWQVDVVAPQTADSGEHVITSQRSEARIEPSTVTGTPGTSQAAVAIATLLPAPEYAWSEKMQVPQILGNLMRSPSPADGAQGGSVVGSSLVKPVATPSAPAAPAVAATQTAPQAMLVPVVQNSGVAASIGTAMKAPQPTPQVSAAAVLVVTVIAKPPAAAATPTPEATATSVLTATPLPTATPEPPPPTPEPPPPPTATSTPRPPTATPRPPTATPVPPPPPEPVAPAPAPPPPPEPTPIPPPPPTPRTGCSVTPSVASASLRKGQTQSVGGVVACDGALAGLPMTALVSYGNATASCSGTANADGSAGCSVRVDDFAQPTARVSVCFTWQGRQFCGATQFNVDP